MADFTGPASYEVVARTRVPVRLGHRVFTAGKLDDETLAQGAKAFQGFRAEMDALGVERYRAVATSATREASNRDRFLDRIRQESDIDLEPITGKEEARLIHLAVRHTDRPLVGGVGCWWTWGGGSVEVLLVNHSSILWSQSHRVGTVAPA